MRSLVVCLALAACASSAHAEVGCDTFHVYFNDDLCDLDVARFGISPSNWTVTGRSSCLPGANYSGWNQGFWPYISGAGVAVNGGVPQAANLSLHLETIAATLQYFVPSFAAYAGNVVIDMEWWVPSFADSSPAYRNLSIALVRAAHADWNESRVEAEATREFEAAALDFIEATLHAYASLMPRARVGLYGYPRNWYYPCAADHNSSQCGYDDPAFGPAARATNDAQARLFAASSALYPSIYLPEHENSSAFFPHHEEYVASVVAEAARLRDAYAPDALVLPFAWDFYHDGRTILLPPDMALELALPPQSGADGVVLWGAAAYYNETQTVLAFLNGTLGPLANKTLADTCACAAQRCNGKGSCTQEGGCRCLPGFNGPTCSSSSSSSSRID